MKQFKLIKTYPGSPIAGSETHEHTTTGFFRLKDGRCIQEYDIFNFPEFWQEITKEWEILSFRGIGNLKNDKNLWTKEKYPNEFHRYSGDDHKDILEIYSVKRNSDGEIFTIGDNCFYNNHSGCIIDSFKFLDENLYIEYNYGSKQSAPIQNIKKLKQPLFRTEDGVDVYENGQYYYLHLHSWFISEAKGYSTFYNQDKLSNNSKYFSTKEAAEEYVLMNKPCLSIAELDALSTQNSGIYVDFKSLKELVKSKL